MPTNKKKIAGKTNTNNKKIVKCQIKKTVKKQNFSNNKITLELKI